MASTIQNPHRVDLKVESTEQKKGRSVMMKIVVCLFGLIVTVVVSGCSTTVTAHRPVELFSAVDLAEARGMAHNNTNNDSNPDTLQNYADVQGMSQGTSQTTSQMMIPVRHWSLWHQTVESNSPAGLLSPGLKRFDSHLLNELTGESLHLGASDANSRSILESVAMPAGIVGGAYVLRPARTNVTQEGGGSSATATGQGGAGGAGGNADSNSNSSATSRSGGS